MEEVIIKNREKKKIFLHSVHVPKQIIERKLFSSVREGFEAIKKAVKGGGVLIHSLREDCKYFCIFMNNTKKVIVCPVVENLPDLFYIPTVYPAELWHKKEYNDAIRKRKLKK